MKNTDAAKRTIAAALVSLVGLTAWCSIPAWAGDLYVYPAKGQSQEQLDRDKFECYQWAKRESGFDPMAAPRTSTPPPAPQAQQGGVVRGAAGGAIAGGVVGAIAGDTKKGLAIGAASGGLLGGARRRNQERQEQHSRQTWEQQETARHTQNREAYNRAYTACLSGRGYTVQ